MKFKYLPIYQSPHSGSPLISVETISDSDIDVRDGKVFCEKTGIEYSIIDGQLHIYNKDHIPLILEKDIQVFAQAHINIENQKNAGVIDTPNSLLREKIYKKAKYLNTEFLFSNFEYERPDKKFVLEIGVGDTSLIQKFAGMEFNCFALDIFPNLMRASGDLYLAEGGSYFERVISPMSHLPFQDNTFDVIYMHAALHHAIPRKQEDFEWCNPNNMRDCMKEIDRVLKSRKNGGALFLLGEGIYPEGTPIESRHYEIQSKKGSVYESWYTISEYIQLFREVGRFPNIFSFQENHIAQIDGFLENGERVNLVKLDDNLGGNNFVSHFFNTCIKNISIEVQKQLLPGWIKLSNFLPDNNADILYPATEANFLPGDVTLIQGFFTLIGCEKVLGGHSIFQNINFSSGFLMFGPYITLEPGNYSVSYLLRLDTISSPHTDSLACWIDVYLEKLANSLVKIEVQEADLVFDKFVTVILNFSLLETANKVEFRVFSLATVPLSCFSLILLCKR